MERCPAYRPWHDQASGRNYVTPVAGKCLHYYFYFIDPELGLCYLRVPTWAPFRLQFYGNGHNVLAAQLAQAGIAFEQADNAFLRIADFARANQLAAELDVQACHAKLDAYASQYCPVLTTPDLHYQWSILQAEYATDIVFRNQATLQALIPPLLEALIQAVKPADIATFLGRKLHGNFQDELASQDKDWFAVFL